MIDPDVLLAALDHAQQEWASMIDCLRIEVQEGWL